MYMHKALHGLISSVLFASLARRQSMGASFCLDDLDGGDEDICNKYMYSCLLNNKYDNTMGTTDTYSDTFNLISAISVRNMGNL